MQCEESGGSEVLRNSHSQPCSWVMTCVTSETKLFLQKFLLQTAMKQCIETTARDRLVTWPRFPGDAYCDRGIDTTGNQWEDWENCTQTHSLNLVFPECWIWHFIFSSQLFTIIQIFKDPGQREVNETICMTVSTDVWLVEVTWQLQ